MRIFRCNHDWNVDQRSNVLQFDGQGYPLRLFIVKCHKCGKYDQHWIDVDISETEELRTGKSVLLEWQ